jgi:hypothetical protein
MLITRPPHRFTTPVVREIVRPATAPAATAL